MSINKNTEFSFLESLRNDFRLDLIGDDCAVLPRSEDTDLLATTDTLVEGIDFRLEWAVPELLGKKALAVSVSDVYAMGGSPEYALSVISVSKNLWKDDFASRLMTGMIEYAKSVGVQIAGGDISETRSDASVTVTVLGSAPRQLAVPRSGALEGDHIYVNGTLGGAGAGLKLLESGARIDNSDPGIRNLIQKQLAPEPSPLAINRHLVDAMIDISDGLVADLDHICTASGVGAELFAEMIPIEPDIERTGFDRGKALEFALRGGEDFRLLLTSPSDDLENIPGSELKRIGRILSKSEKLSIVEEGVRSSLNRKGFEHFS
ncbi:MAG: thiamine-phosphate kinase [Pyrinomonadaceae bacterium]